MALLLNVSLSSKLPPFPIPKPHISFPKPHLDSSLFHNTNSATPQGNGINFDHLHLSVTRGSFVALLSASLFFVDPALAFKGGGPYGSEVTRGQDLTGKDFSGKSLIKQDFKTSILRQANFKGANLLGASFFDADLTGADLSDADLRGADFSLANVTKVIINLKLKLNLLFNIFTVVHFLLLLWCSFFALNATSYLSNVIQTLVIL
ncbi:hypothetical protein PVL29_016685 [Vitis rotundifolia]|uniref:Thylakoid lumenal 15 kDa protein 1, chloroplastic n=1 Tax=Vitis rotundifolia TaxID=103349 RepID=A0AA38Z8F3_VITRO|nr:hypothetical protein PVL29_016685 [Vitis rotundifolia]